MANINVFEHFVRQFSPLPSSFYAALRGCNKMRATYIIICVLLASSLSQAKTRKPAIVRGFQGQDFGKKGPISLTLDEKWVCGTKSDPKKNLVPFMFRAEPWGIQRVCSFKADYLGRPVEVRVAQHDEIGLYSVSFGFHPEQNEQEKRAEALLRRHYQGILRYLKNAYGKPVFEKGNPESRSEDSELLWGAYDKDIDFENGPTLRAKFIRPGMVFLTYEDRVLQGKAYRTPFRANPL